MEQDRSLGRLTPGRVLVGRYVVADMIGRGGMAEVYRGRDRRLARPVALKVLRPQFAHDPSLRLRFEEEAKAAALVSHPNVVGVYDAGEDSEPAAGDQPSEHDAFIVMELVVGESLAQRIARGPLESAEVRRIGGQILDALAAAHARGVLHRDIKPANVLLTDDGTAKVADFGIAKAVHPSPDNDEPTAMNIVLGTPGYLAPERAQGNPATVRSDLWSVGVLLYEAMTGVRPFAGDNPISVTLAAQEGRYEPLLERRPDADRAVAAIVTRALDPDPDNRFASAAEMGRALKMPDVHTVPLTSPLLTGTTDTAEFESEGAGGGGAGAAGAGAAGAGAAAAGARAAGAGAAAAGAAGLAGAAYLAEERGGAGAGGGALLGPTAAGPPPPAVPLTGQNQFDPPYDAPSPKPHRRGSAVLAAAAIVLLLAGVTAIILVEGRHSPPPVPGATTSSTRPGSSRTSTLPTSTAGQSSSTSSTTSSNPPTTNQSSTTSSTTSSSTTSTTGPTSTTTTTIVTTTTGPTTTTTTADPTTTTTTATTSPGNGGSSTTTTTSEPPRSGWHRGRWPTTTSESRRRGRPEGAAPADG